MTDGDQKPPSIKAKIFGHDNHHDNIYVFKSNHPGQLLEVCYSPEDRPQDQRKPLLTLDKELVGSRSSFFTEGIKPDVKTIAKLLHFLMQNGITEDYVTSLLKRALPKAYSQFKNHLQSACWREMLRIDKSEPNSPLNTLFSRGGDTPDLYVFPIFFEILGKDKPVDEMTVSVNMKKFSLHLIQRIIEVQPNTGHPVSEERAKRQIIEWRNEIKHPKIQKLCDAMLAQRNLEAQVCMENSLFSPRKGADGCIKNLPIGGQSFQYSTRVEMGESQPVGVFIEELAHQAINMVRRNQSKPYRKSKDLRHDNAFFRAVKADCENIDDAMLRADLHLPKEYYSHEDYDAEVPAKIIRMMGTGEWDKKGLGERYPHLSEFTDALVDNLIERLDRLKNKKHSQAHFSGYHHPPRLR